MAIRRSCHVVGCLSLGLVILAACSNEIGRTNANDPNGTGPKNPGRIAGSVYVQGFLDPSPFAVHVYDEQGAETTAVHPDADGAFLTGEIPAGTYWLELDHPIENTPAFKNDVVVAPGLTTHVGVLSSTQAPPVGRVSGSVTLEDSEESFANIRVVATRRVGDESQSWLQYTSASGYYLFDELPPGTYELRADREQFTPDWKEVALTVDARAPVTAPDMKLYPASAVVRFSVPTADGDVIGARFTNTRSVELLLLAFGGVNQMRLAETSDFTTDGAPVAWRDHLAQIEWQLSAGEGEKTVYAQFRVVDEDDNERLRSETYTTQVILDQTPPDILGFVVGQEPVEKAGKIFITGDLSAVPVSVRAFDAYSSIAQAKIVVEAADPTQVPYDDVTSHSATVQYSKVVALSPEDGNKEVAIQLRDGAGNETSLLSKTVTVDTTPPSELASPALAVAPLVGTSLTSQTVALSFLVGGDEAAGIDGPVEMAFGLSPAPAVTTTWGSFSPSAGLQLTQGTGAVVELWARFRDLAGNVLEVTSPTYTLVLEGGISGRAYVEGTPETDPGHEDTLVEVFDIDANLTVDAPLATGMTLPDAGYLVGGLPAGTYQVRFSRPAAITVTRAPIAVANARLTPMGVERMLLARGDLTGYFKYGNRHPTTGNHAGISVSAILDGAVQGVTVTDETGLANLPDLPVGTNYTIRASAEGYASKTVTGVVVLCDLAGLIAGGIDQYLTRVAGDFKLCNLLDPLPPALPADCEAVLYSNEPELLLGLSTDAALVTHVRYVLQDPAHPGEESFTTPSANPADDACASPPAEDCWNPYSPTTSYTVATPVSDDVLTYVVQFFGADNTRQPVGTSQVVYDTEAPLAPSITIDRGAAALAEGYTNAAQVAVSVDAVATYGSEEEAAPLHSIRLSYDPAWEGDGTGGDRLFSFGGVKLFDLETLSGDGLKDVFAWVCDAAKNCSSVPISAAILLDRQAPARAAGVDIAPTGQAIVAHATLPRTSLTRGVVFGVDVALGDSGYAVSFGGVPYNVPEAAAYQLSASPQFTGAQWVEIDPSVQGAGDTLSASGLTIDPMDGSYTIQVRFKDLAGNVTTTSDSNFVLILDRVGPIGEVVLDGGALYTNSTTLSAAVGVNPVGDATLLQYAVNSSLPVPYPTPDTRQPFQSTLSLPLASPLDSDGEKLVRVRLFDAAGNYDEVEDSIILDTTAPANTLAQCTSCTADAGGIAYFNGDLAGQVRLFLYASDALSGVESVAVLVDAGTLDEHLEAAGYAPYVPVNVSSANGLHTLEVSFVDRAGNASMPVPLVVEYDDVVPSVTTVQLNGGAAWTADATVAVTVTAGDSGDASRLRGMYVSNSAAFGGAVLMPFSDSFSWTLDTSTGDGSRELFVKVIDYAGNAATRSATIVLDRQRPSVSASAMGLLADGSPSTAVTANPSVTLELTVSDAGTVDPAALEMQVVSNASDFATASWTPFAASSVRALANPAEDGLKTLYVRVRDLAGNIADSQAAILLDITEPTAPSIALPGAYSAATSVGAVLSAAGATQMCLHGDITGDPGDGCAADSAGWEAFTGTKTIDLTSGDGSKTVSVRFRDAARWVVGAATAVKLDTQAPAGTLAINAGDAGTASAVVTLSLTASDAQAPGSALRMAITNDVTCVGGDYEAFNNARTWWLSDTDGLRSVNVCLQDPAGNVVEISDSIVLDRTPPLAPVVVVGSGATHVATAAAVSVTLSAGEATEICISGDIASPLDCADDASWVPYATSVAVDLEPISEVAAYPFGDSRRVTVRFRDGAGNTVAASDSVILDPAGPHSPQLELVSANPSRVATVTLRLSAVGATQMCLLGDFAEAAADCAPASGGWEPMALTKAVNLDLEGDNAVSVVFRDALQRQTSPVSATVTLDSTAPGGASLLINAGAASTNNRNVTVALAASGATLMAVGNNAVACASATYEPFSAARAWVLEDIDGTRTVAVCFKDDAGNTTSTNDTIELDRTPPSLSAVLINGGAAYTASADVTLTLGSSGANEMCIEGDLAAPLACEPYGTGKSVTLAAGDGAKSVSVTFRDNAGNQERTSASIVLDTQSAYGEQITLSPASYTTIATVTALLNATGAVEMCLWGSIVGDPGDDCAVDSTGWEPFAASRSIQLAGGEGTNSVNVKYRDGALGESGIATATITLDSTPPAAASVQVNGAAAYTNSVTVTLTLAATDAGSGVARMVVANGDIPSCADGSLVYEPFAGSRAWTLVASEGARSVAVCFKDNAGNTVKATDSITLDTVAPSSPSVSVQASGVDVSSTSTAAVDLALAAVGADEMCISGDIAGAADCSSAAGWQAFATGASAVLLAGDGTKIVTVRFRDFATNSVQASDSVVLDTQPPASPALVLSPSDYANGTTGAAIDAMLSAVGADEVCLWGDIGVSAADCDNSTGTAWEAYTTLKSVTLVGADGTKVVLAKFRDAGNGVSVTVSDSVVLDRMAPASPTVLINDGDGAVSALAVSLAVSAVDATSGVTQMAVRNGAIPDCSVVTYSAYTESLLFTLAGTDGTRAVTVCFQDAAGNSSSASDTITLDRVAPSGVELRLNGGSPYATATSVSVELFATETVSSTLEYRISDAAVFADSGWVSVPAAGFPLALADLTLANGTHDRYLWVRDEAGNMGSASDRVIVDTVGPELLGVSFEEGAAVAGAAAMLRIRYNGADTMDLAGDLAGAGTDLPVSEYVPVSLTQPDALNTVTVGLEDAAGNASTPASLSASIYRDETAPQNVAITINNGDAYTRDRNVVLGITADGSAEGDDYGPVAMAIAAGGIDCATASYSDLAAFAQWTLSVGSGSKTVAVCLRDIAGNTAAASDTIILDTAAPVVAAFALNNGQSYSDSDTIAWSMSATDNLDLDIDYEVTTDPVPSGNWTAAGGLSASGTLTLADGNYVYYLHLRDDAGNATSDSAQVVIDTIEPFNPTISLSPSPYTTDAAVTALVEANDATEMCITGDLATAVDCTAGGGGWEAHAASKALTLSAGDGAKTVYAQFRDAAGNTTAVVSASVIRDGLDPSGSLTLDSGAAYTAERPVLVEVSAADANGVTGLALGNAALDCDAVATAYEAFSATRTYILADSDGLQTVKACLRDSAGRTGSASSSITLDRTAPANVSLVLGSGAYSTSATVAVQVSANESSTWDYLVKATANINADDAWVEDAAIGNATVSATDLTLSDGTHTYYLFVRDAAGNIAGGSDTITVDTSGPTLVDVQFVAGAVTGSASAMLQVQASGGDEMRITYPDATSSGWIAFSEYASITLSNANAGNAVTVELRDRAGNLSTPVSDSTSIYRDTLPPQGIAVAINGGDAHTNSRNVTLSFSTDGEATYGTVELAVADGSVASCADADYSAYTSFMSWTLPNSQGSNSVVVCFRDTAGNYDSDTDAIHLDTVAPTPTFDLHDSGGYATSSTVDYHLTSSETPFEYEITTSPTPTQAVASTWGDASPTSPVSGSLAGVADGSATYYLHVKDAAGNVTTVSDSVIVDTQAPSLASISLSPIPYATSTSITATVSAAGATRMCFFGDVTDGSADNCGVLGWVDYNTSRALTLTAGDATKTVSVLFRDGAGNTTVAASAGTVLDTTAPYLNSPDIVIDGGASYSASRTVTLTFDVVDPDDVVEVGIESSASIDCDTVAYEVFRDETVWVLPMGDSGRSVRACYKDVAGNAVAGAAASIIVDTTAPSAVSIVLDDATYNTTRSLGYRLEASDANPIRYELTTSPSPTGAWTSAGFPIDTDSGATPITVTQDGAFTYYLHVRDAAGNTTSTSDSVIVDTSAPYAPLLTLSPSPYATSTGVTASLGATGATEMCVWGDFSGSPSDSCVPASSGWEAMTATKALILSSGDGGKSVQVKYRDSAGWESATATASVTLDATNPTNGSVTLTGLDRNGASTTLTRVQGITVTLAGFSDATSGISDMMVSERSDFLGAVWEPYSTSFTRSLSAGDGSKTLYVKVRDSAQRSSAYSTGSITLDTTPPQNASVLIDGGADYTNDAAGAVSLALSATGANWMRITADGGYDGGLGAYNSSSSATISGEGLRTVYVVFTDNAGNSTPAVTDTIRRDVTGPTGTGVLINNGDIYATSVSATLALTATGADQVQIATDGGCDTETWVAYATSAVALLSAGDGTKTVCVRYRDSAGNTSSPTYDTIVLDATRPTLPLIVTSSQVVDAASITITIAAPVTETHFEAYEIAGGPSSYPVFTQISTTRTQTSFTVNLDQDFENNLRMRAVDLAGNVSEESAVRIIEDSTAPEQPQNIEFIAGNHQVFMRWDASPSADVVDYRVRYSSDCIVGAGGVDMPGAWDGSFASEGPSPIFIGDVTGFVLTGLPNHNDICILVQAVDRAGHLSADPTADGEGSAKRRPGQVTPEWVAKDFHPDGNGIPYSVAVSGDIVLVAERCTWGSGAVTADNPSPDETCSSNDGSLRIISIADPSNPVQLARCSGDAGQACGFLAGDTLVDVRDVVTDGIFAYVANGARGIAVLNIADPNNPTRASTGTYCRHDGNCLPSGGFAWGIDYQAGIIYVADGPGGFRALENHYVRYIYSSLMRRCSGVLSTTCANNLGADADGAVANVPLSSSEYDITTTNRRCVAYDVDVVGPYAFYTVGASSMSWCQYPHRALHVVRLVDDSSDGVGNNIGTTSAFYPTGQQVVSSFPLDRPRRLYVSGDVLAVGNLFDLDLFHLPRLIAGDTADNSRILKFQVNQNPIMAAVAGPVLIVGGAQNLGSDAFKLYDLASLDDIIAAHSGVATYANNLPLLARWGSADYSGLAVNNVVVQGSLAFIPSGEPGGSSIGLQIIDLQTPLVPEEVALTDRITLDMNHYNTSLKAFDRYLFYQQSGSSLGILDVSDITDPALVASITNSASNTQVFDVAWPYLYTGAAGNTVEVYDLTIPASPALVAAVSVPAPVTAVALHGRYLLVGAGANGTYTYNASYPARPLLVKIDTGNNPAPIGTTSADGEVFDIDARAGVMYVAEGGGGANGFAAVALAPDNFVSGAYAGSFGTLSSYSVSVSAVLDGPRRSYLWGGRLYGAVWGGSDVILGRNTFTDAQLGEPILVSNVAFEVNGGNVFFNNSHGYGGSGRFVYDSGATQGKALICEVGRDWASDADVVVWSYILGPYDLADSAAIGPYVVFASRSNELRFFHVEY